jgi:hypothetical protein
MASQNLNVGTSANSGDGMSLRQAFVNTRKMFADMYGITYSSDTQDISGSTFGIDYAQLANRYASKIDHTGTGDLSIECDDASVFLITGNVATATYTFNDMKQNQVVDLILSGTLSSAAITFAGGTGIGTTTFNKVGSTNFDTSKTNHITLICVKESSGSSIVNYTVNSYTSDSNPD